MLLLTWLVQLTLMTFCVSAFHPSYPEYRCYEEGKCPATVSKRESDERVVLETPTLKIKQRVSTNDLPHEVRINRYLARLTKKFAHSSRSISKRSNTYSIATAVAPTQTNSAALDQDGTDYSYFAVVNFGSNATPLYMLMDTGASATWVMATSCQSPACLVHNTYGPTNSKTYKASSGVFDLAYGTGHVSGAVASDTISFAGFTLSLSFGVANSTSDDFLHFPFDGIMGLARDQGSYPTVLQTIASANALKSNVFGVNLDRDSDGVHNGEINFGGPDISKYTGNLSYTALSSSNGDWSIAADGVGVDGISAGLTGKSAYIDTGTSYIFIPADDAKALHSLIAGSQLSSDGTSWYVPCNTKSVLQFTFSGVSYNVSSEDWVGGRSGGSLCTSNIFPGTPVGANNWLLGDTFIKNVYAVFDSDQKRIGFGTKPTPTSVSTTTTGYSSTSTTTTSSLASGPGSMTFNTMTSNTISAGPSLTSGTSGTSGPPNSSSTAVHSSSPGSSGFNAAITSSSISVAAATLSSSSPSSPSTSPAVQDSSATGLELQAILVFAILLATIVIIS